MLEISASTKLIIDGVFEEAFREVEDVFETLSHHRCQDVVVRAGLRSFFEPTLRSSRDLSAEQLKVCRVLVRCIALLRAKPIDRGASARTVFEQTRLDELVIAAGSGSLMVATALKSGDRTEMLAAIQDLAAGFSNEARQQQFSAAIAVSTTQNDAYKIVAQHCANETARDCLDGDKDIFRKPLWTTDDAWRNHIPENSAFETFQQGEAFEFWRRWYQGFVIGRPLDWALQTQVALIDDAVWDAGAEAVAAAIREIEANLGGPAPLEEKALREHVGHFLTNPVLSAATALNGAETIERAISDYLRDAPANCLPEDLKHLEALPRHFKAIARVIGNKTDEGEKESLLVDEISMLHARVTELEGELAVAKSKALKGIISQEAAKSFGKTIGSPLFWSGAAVSVGYFFGVAPSDLTLENFRNYVAELLRANAETAPPAQPPLLSSIDV